MHTVALRGLLVLLWFGGISSVAGGVLGVFANGAGVPLAYLRQTPFTSYLVPGLLLGVVIGGTQLVAVTLLQRRNRFGLPAAVLAGFGMIVWIFVEVTVMSEYSPLQPICLALGVAELTLVFSALGLLSSLRSVGSHGPDIRVRPWSPGEL